MKYIRLFLKGFKPLLYGGTHQLELTDMSQIVILSGENGKGKSSVLRELSPYPATRTDYVYKSDVMTQCGRRIGNSPYIVEISEIESIDIDEAEDFLIADAVFNHLFKENQG